MIKLPTVSEVLQKIDPCTGFTTYRIVFPEKRDSLATALIVSLVVRRRWYNLFQQSVEVAGRIEYVYDSKGNALVGVPRIIRFEKDLYAFMRDMQALGDGTTIEPVTVIDYSQVA